VTLMKFIHRELQASSRVELKRALSILEEYEGKAVTLRQLYYRFVAKNYFPNSEKSYDRLGEILNVCRLVGKLSWDSIIDRTRSLATYTDWETAEDAMSSTIRRHNNNKWTNQDVWPEAWIEKEALIGVIEEPCGDYQVPYFACRGYTSQSEMWAACMRMADRWLNRQQRTLILYMGDHDPSGLNMSDNLQERLEMFGVAECTELRRIALNMDQIKKHNPPPQPNKISDGRERKYREKFGPYSWELDSLPPGVLGDILHEHVKPLIDAKKWNARIDKQEKERNRLRDAQNWLRKQQRRK
jgi:hypothetical protein